MSRDALTAERLREVLDYCPDTGLFRWRIRVTNAVTAGEVTGCKYKNGYLAIRLDGYNWQAHRLAWLYVHGSLPEPFIDHINGVRDDNRIANLRPASKQVNSRNQGLRSDNTSGFRGVTKHKNRWVARLKLPAGPLYCGIYETPEQASQAYLAARAVHFPTQPIPREFLA